MLRPRIERTTPPPGPLPEAERGRKTRLSPPLRFGEGAGGRGLFAQDERGSTGLGVVPRVAGDEGAEPLLAQGRREEPYRAVGQGGVEALRRGAAEVGQ